MNIVRWPEPMPESGRLPMAKDAYDWGICKVADPLMSCPQRLHINCTRMVWAYIKLLNAIHRSLQSRQTSYRLLALMCGSLALAGCDQPTAVPVAAPPHVDIRPNYGPSNPAGISGLNYTTYYIASFSITDADGQTGGGPNIYPSKGDGEPAGGGAEMCCVMVPKKWHKDMTVTVRWRRDTHPYDHQNRTGDQWLKAVAKIPPYTSLTHGFWVRFLSNDRIVVQVNDQEWYIPKPIANQDAYVVQGVLDKTITKETQQ